MRSVQLLLALSLLLRGPGAHAATIDRLDLDALRGKVVLVDFWASWCAPCKESFPWMQRMQNRLGGQGLVIVAVNLDQDQKAADEFLHRLRPSFSILFDPQAALAQRYRVDAMPSSYFLDRRGRQRFAHAGFTVDQHEAFEKELQALLAEPPPADEDRASAPATGSTDSMQGEKK